MLWQRGLKFLLASVFMLLGTSGCEHVREILDMNHSAPDEFSETPLGQDLTIPPSFDRLPKPQSDGGGIEPFGSSCPSTPVLSPQKPQTAGQDALLKKINQKDASQNRQTAL